MTDDLHGIGTALRDRVADEHPDLDRLIRVSTDAGARLRRRRTVGTALCVVAGVAVVVLVGSTLGGSGGPAGTEAPPASQPTATPSTTSDVVQELRSDDRQDLVGESAAGAPDVTASRPAVAPVRVDLPGWQCDEPADEKFICSQGPASVVVTWRTADVRADYLDPGKADVYDDVDTFVSEQHGGYFVTIAPAPGTTQEQVDAVGLALAWVD